MSFSSSSHLPCCGRACVWTIWIDVKLLICRGPLYPSPGSGQRRAWCRVLKTYLLFAVHGRRRAQLGGKYIYIYIYIFIYVSEPFLCLALWNQNELGSFVCLAHWKQSHSCVWLFGTKMNPGPFLCLALWNQKWTLCHSCVWPIGNKTLSHSCVWLFGSDHQVYIYIYIYIIFILLLGLTGLSLHVRCVPHQQFDKTFLSKCVCVCVCVCVKFRSFDRPHASTACLPQLLGSQTYSDEFDPSNPRSPVSYQWGFNYSAPKTERNPQNDMNHKTLEPIV